MKINRIIGMNLNIFILLITLFLITIEFNLFRDNIAIDYDEIIALNIGKQPWEMFFKTISTEPHPIGYYLILKALSGANALFVRLLFSIVSSNIIIISLVIGNHYKTWDKNKLSAGVLLFLSSFVYVHSTTRIKPDTLSLPLFILFITLYLIYKELKLKRSRILNWMALVTIAIMMLNLRTFVFVGIVWGYEIISLIKVQGLKSSELRRILIRMILVGSIMIIYMGLFGAQQFVNNKFRMSWINPSENKLSNNIIIDIFPYAKFYLRIIGYSEFLYVFLVVIILREIKLTKDSRESGINKDILYITIISIVSGYVTKSFIEQPRYAAPAIFLILLLLSKYLSKIDLRIFVVMVFINLSFSVQGVKTYVKSIQNNHEYVFNMLNMYSLKDYGGIIFMTDGYPLAPVYLSFMSSEKSDLAVANVYSLACNKVDNSIRYVDYNVLSLDKNGSPEYWDLYGRRKTITELNSIFRIGVSRVLYTTSYDERVRFMRKDILSFLNDRCSIVNIEEKYGLTGTSIYYKNCVSKTDF